MAELCGIGALPPRPRPLVGGRTHSRALAGCHGVERFWCSGRSKRQFLRRIVTGDFTLPPSLLSGGCFHPQFARTE